MIFSFVFSVKPLLLSSKLVGVHEPCRQFIKFHFHETGGIINGQAERESVGRDGFGPINATG